MSAKNWTGCPKCERNAETERSAAIEEAAKVYGKVPSEQWARMKKKADKPVSLEATMREDYQLGILDAPSGPAFFVHYSCQCQTCGFEHGFKHEEPVSL